MKDREVFEAALKVFGGENQTVVAIEEMGELIKELCKFARGENNVHAIAEEIADVKIMLEQLELLHNCGEEAELEREYKIARLAQRIINALEADNGTAGD